MIVSAFVDGRWGASGRPRLCPSLRRGRSDLGRHARLRHFSRRSRLMMSMSRFAEQERPLRRSSEAQERIVEADLTAKVRGAGAIGTNFTETRVRSFRALVTSSGQHRAPRGVAMARSLNAQSRIGLPPRQAPTPCGRRMPNVAAQRGSTSIRRDIGGRGLARMVDPTRHSLRSDSVHQVGANAAGFIAGLPSKSDVGRTRDDLGRGAPATPIRALMTLPSSCLSQGLARQTRNPTGNGRSAVSSPSRYLEGGSDAAVADAPSRYTNRTVAPSPVLRAQRLGGSPDTLGGQTRSSDDSEGQSLILTGEIILDGRKLGQLVSERQARTLLSEPSGSRQVNVRATPVSSALSVPPP